MYYDYYFNRQESLWRQNAMKTLPVLLNSSDMLACGEDLGLIPSCVHPVRKSLFLFFLCYFSSPEVFLILSDTVIHSGHGRTWFNWIAYSTDAK